VGHGEIAIARFDIRPIFGRYKITVYRLLYEIPKMRIGNFTESSNRLYEFLAIPVAQRLFKRL
jgi:hypothetical protein